MALSLQASEVFHILKSGGSVFLRNAISSALVAINDAGSISINAGGTNQNVGVNPTGTGGFTISGTSALRGIRSATASIDFASMAAGAANSQTMTVTGAAVGDAVFVSTADGSAHPDEITVYGFVSAANTVSLRAVNRSAGVYDPAAKVYRAVVLSF